MKRIRFSIAIWLFLPCLIFVITGCGGGKSSSGNTNNTNSTTAKTVSGFVSTDTGTTVGDNAAVTITSYTKTGTKVDAVSATSNLAGAFNSTVKMNDAGGYVVVKADKDGFTSSSERLDFDSPKDMNKLVTKAAKATTVTAEVTDSGQVFSAARKGFSLGVVRFANGTRKALAGSSLKKALASHGATAELEILIPANSVPAGTTTLTGQIATFDSSNPDDAKYFPGEYMDSDGNKLMSLAFDYIKITDASGNNLGKAVKKAKAAGKLLAGVQTTPTVITRGIPSGSCGNVIRDEDAAMNGYQIPVYSVNDQGSWDLVGLGTVTLDGIIIPADQFSLSLCQSGSYDLRIEVTNEVFASEYLNLDYPILGEPKQVCLKGTVKDGSGNPLSEVGLTIYDTYDSSDAEQSFGYAGVRTDSNGNYTITTLLTDNTDTDRTGEVLYYNPVSYEPLTVSVTLGNSPDCGTADITITTPEMCSVTAKVVDEAGLPQTGVDILIFGTSPYYYNGTEKAVAGFFTATVPCDQSLNVYTGNWTGGSTFNISGNTSDNPSYEISDNGSTVELMDIEVDGDPATLTMSINSGAAATYDNVDNENKFIAYSFSEDGYTGFEILFDAYEEGFNISFSVQNPAVGTYEVSRCTSIDKFTLIAFMDDWSKNEDYGADCNPVSGTGTLTITQADDVVGGRVKGNFNFTLKEYTEDLDTDEVTYSSATKTISGTFDVPRVPLDSDAM